MMQLGSLPARGPRAEHLAEALRLAARAYGHRPAITVLSPRDRQEQSYTSLAQWAAKGAHHFTLDLLLEPGDRVGLQAPAGWGTAAVALAAWWAGLEVTLDGPAEVAVVHESVAPPWQAQEVFVLGDGFDGSPLGAASGEPWVRAVQSFPDQPPVSPVQASSPALHVDSRAHSHRELIDAALADTASGVLGLDAGPTADVDALRDTAIRPLLTGHATVVLRDVERDRAEGDRVAHWRG